ncbi:hypothetical protein [Agaribacterium sp. ZY112]|uniref:hypothetical protein n=1 Tax=Agaribacterium sp. ZY112 TaxID=3233574 RepID=UPI003524973C
MYYFLISYYVNLQAYKALGLQTETYTSASAIGHSVRNISKETGHFFREIFTSDGVKRDLNNRFVFKSLGLGLSTLEPIKSLAAKTVSHSGLHPCFISNYLPLLSLCLYLSYSLF